MNGRSNILVFFSDIGNYWWLQMKCLIFAEEIDVRSGLFVERGIKTLIWASKDRGHGKYKTSEELKSVPLHKTCWKNYTRKHSIAAVNKKPSEQSTSQAHRLCRSETKTFNFQSDCILWRRSKFTWHKNFKKIDVSLYVMWLLLNFNPWTTRW